MELGCDHEKAIWLRRYVPDPGAPLFKQDYELRRLYFSAYHLSPSKIREYVDVMNNYGARVLVGYASSVYILALLLEDSGLRLKYVRAAHVAFRKSSSPMERENRAGNGYPRKSALWHGGEGQHVFSMRSLRCLSREHGYGVTEFIDDGGNRQVVGTGFLNYTMPFIRYQMNDYATLNPDGPECACGRGLPLTVLDFEGRRDDVLVTPDGRLVPGGNFYVMTYEIPGIEMFQIIQHEPGRVEIKLVTSKSFTDENLQRVKEGMFKRMETWSSRSPS